MPFLTNEDIKERKEQGVRMYKLDCGWRMSSELLTPIITALNAWEPQTEVEKRDKHICELAFIHDMNAQQIKRLNDPLIIGMGNRSKGKPLSATSILSICYKYFPEAADRPRKQNPHAQKRNEVFSARRNGEINRPKICATCGAKKDIDLHHIIPLAAGGTNDYFNMIYLCYDCHMKLHHQIYDKLSIPNQD